MNRLLGIVFFITLLVFSVAGCSVNTKKDVTQVQNKQEKPYPDSGEKVALAFVREIVKGNFIEAEKYTHALDFNGGGYKDIKNELGEDPEIGSWGGYKGETDFGFDLENEYSREIITRKIDGKWKVTETYVNTASFLKGFAVYIMRVEARDKRVLYNGYKGKKKEIDYLLKFFKYSKPSLSYPKLGSVDQKLEVKVYRKDTNEGVVFDFEKDQKGKYARKWTLRTEFRD